MAAQKVNRTQSVSGKEESLVIHQEITNISGNVSINYQETVQVGKTKLPPNNKSENANIQFNIPSQEELEKVAAENPWLSPFIAQLQEKISNYYK